MTITLNIHNEQLFDKIMWLLSRFKNDGLEIITDIQKNISTPTFIYAAINTLLDEKVDLKKVALLLFPVGFVNVIESKEYAKRFRKNFDVPAVIMQGRFGSSTMGVATLHATYKLIKDYDGTTHYNGKK